MTDILNKILTTKALEVATQKTSVSLDEMKKQADAALPVRGFFDSIRSSKKIKRKIKRY